MRAVFHMPQRKKACGSHIHVSRGRNRPFTLPELKTIAYGFAVYEKLVLQLLMACRQQNVYCKANSQGSTRLRSAGGNRAQIASMIRGASSPNTLRDIMQDNRYVLWNFDNVTAGRSGTIEFRGGRFRSWRGAYQAMDCVCGGVHPCDALHGMFSFNSN